MANDKHSFDPGVLENILNSVPQGIFWKDLNSVYQGCNAVFARAFGLDSPEQVVGKSDFDLKMPRDLAEVYRADDHDVIVNNRPKRHIEEQIQQADGTRLWVDTTKVPLIDETGRIYGVLGIYKDITERKLAVEALRESETLLRATLESTADGILVVDDMGRCTHTNAHFARMWHIPEDLIKSRDDSKLILYVLDQLEDPNAFVSKVKALYQSTAEDFDTLKFKDGRFFERYSCPLMRDNRIAGRVWSFRDITDRKHAEDSLSRYRDDLEKIVQERTAELESFCYSVSHDLRAPLRSACGFSQALMEDWNDKLDTQGKDYLRRIQAATRRMDVLIDAILGLSRVTRKDLAVQDVNLSSLALTVLEDLRTVEPQRHVDFICPDKLMAKCDLELFRVVMTNLLGNAWKFTARVQQAKIELGKVFSEDGSSNYFVKDNGIGFDMAYSDKLFAPFQRLHTEKEFQGAGIGLATVRRILTRHGGRVWAQSEPGKGTTFYFSLPAGL